jgi:hypothetical protein
MTICDDTPADYEKLSRLMEHHRNETIRINFIKKFAIGTEEIIALHLTREDAKKLVDFANKSL